MDSAELNKQDHSTAYEDAVSAGEYVSLGDGWMDISRLQPYEEGNGIVRDLKDLEARGPPREAVANSHS
jgi:hypothetical protein